MVLLKSVSIVLLFAIGLIAALLRSGSLICDDEASRLVLVVGTVTLYLARTALANCTTPLNQSITMDFVPKNQRGRWSATQTVVQACWSGSAAVGGVLADRFGYGFIFFVTVAFHLAGTLMQATLLSIVPKEE
jgi:MFS family permease